MRELFARMDPQSSIWVAMGRPQPGDEPEGDHQASVDGGWLTLRWDGGGLRIRAAAHFVGGKTLDSWLDDMAAIFLRAASLKGIEVDPETIRARMVTSRRDDWHQVELGWTGVEIDELLERADAMAAPPAPPPATALPPPYR
jgi:hypothetical protein